MRVTYKVLGLREADAALAELTKATAKAVGRRVLLRAAAPIAERARELAPKRTGNLAASIHATTKKPKGHASKAAFAEAMRNGATRAQAAAAQRAFNRDNPGSFSEAFVAVGEEPQAWPQEIGTAIHSPQPYMRPALEEKAAEALDIIAAELKPEIEKAAARARQRALRKAPKG